MKREDIIFELGGADEKIVRTYECTQLHRLLAPTTMGFLTITNKRVVFHSKGRSLVGRSLLINEMPLEDAAGVRAYLEITVNWLYFALLSALAGGILWLLSAKAPFLTHWALGLALILPFSAIWVLNSSFLSEGSKQGVFRYIDEHLQNKVQSRELFQVLAPAMRVPFLIGSVILGWNIAFSGVFRLFGPLNLVVLLAIFFGIYLYFIGQHRTFTLAIGSRTMKGTGIFIPGTSLLTILTRDTTAPDTLGASPGRDAETITRELGAILIDIRQLGDLGIKKWSA